MKKTSDGIRLDLPTNMVKTTLKQLIKYGAFSKVEIELMHESEHLHNKKIFLQQGIVFLYPETSLMFTPQMINWQKHGGVDFEKGCYLGQEIIARTEHLGKLKRHLYRFELPVDTTANPGDKLVNQKSEEIGVLCDSLTDNGHLSCLAVIEDRALSDKIYFNESTIDAVMA